MFYQDLSSSDKKAGYKIILTTNFAAGQIVDKYLYKTILTNFNAKNVTLYFAQLARRLIIQEKIANRLLLTKLTKFLKIIR